MPKTKVSSVIEIRIEKNVALKDIFLVIENFCQVVYDKSLIKSLRTLDCKNVKFR